ncbi:SAM-dependent chlorinase/fluorinase [bacterium]|nr:SAM-dependent chlorinase/fluorinase [bacterium]
MATFRGRLLKAGVDLPFIEISSSIEAFDIIEASYLSSMVYDDFPKNTIHILASNVVATSFAGHIAARYQDQIFLAPDNGILPLTLPDGFDDYYLIPTESYEQDIHSVYVPFIQKLIEQGYNLDQTTVKTDQYHTKSKLVPVNDGRELRGTILFVDHFGNAYSNISRTDFESFVGNRSYRINLSKHERVERVSENFADVMDGDALCFFSSHDKVVVAIKKGNAEQLLNLRKYKPVIVELI